MIKQIKRTSKDVVIDKETHLGFDILNTSLKIEIFNSVILLFIFFFGRNINQIHTKKKYRNLFIEWNFVGCRRSLSFLEVEINILEFYYILR